MKAFLILCTLAAFGGIAMCTARQAIEHIEIVCMFEANVTEPELKRFFGKSIRASEANAKLKCLMKCLMEKRGMLKDGVYNSTRAIQELTSIPEMKGREDEIKESVNGCKAERGINDCDTAFKITMCLLEYKSRHE